VRADLGKTETLQRRGTSIAKIHQKNSTVSTKKKKQPMNPKEKAEKRPHISRQCIKRGKNGKSPGLKVDR